MDLTSLPDEMLANLWKYSDYVTINRFRKLNSRMNNVAKSFDMGTKLPVKGLWINGNNLADPNKPFSLECNTSVKSSVLNYIKYPTKPDYVGFNVILRYKNKEEEHINILSNIISKIEIEGPLSIGNFLDMNEQLFTSLKANQNTIAGLTNLEVFNTPLSCSSSTFRDFVKSTKKLHAVGFTEWRGHLDVLFHAGMFEDQHWDKIQLISRVENFKRFWFFTSRICFNVDGIIKMIRRYVREPYRKNYISLGRICCEEALFEMTEEKIVNSLNGLNVEYSSCDNNDHTGLRKECKIFFAFESTMCFQLFDGIE